MEQIIRSIQNSDRTMHGLKQVETWNWCTQNQSQKDIESRTN